MKLMWMGMSTYANVCDETIPKEEYDQFHQHKVTYLKAFKSVAGPQRRCRSRTGTGLSKLHALLHFSWQMHRYGSAINYDGKFRESDMIVFLKRPDKRTQKQKEYFAQDVANRWSEQQTISHYVHTMKKSKDCSPSEQQIDDSVTLSAKKFHFK